MKLLSQLLLLPPPLLLLPPPAVLRETCIGVHAYSTLSDDTLRALPTPGHDFDINTGKLLAPILRTRVPGTEGSRAVLQHFADFFNDNLPEWKLSFQNSSSTTPTSNGDQVPFVNLIANRDPPWTKGDGDVGRLSLVAHYDSKLTPEGFIGATDSAAPCAMLLHAARSIDAALTAKWNAMSAAGNTDDDLEGHQGVQILLLDGEEAFHTWTHTDSLYGARSLAAEWETTMFGYGGGVFESPLRTIELFVLLDLLGSKDPKVPSYFKTTHWAYQKMAEAETRLRAAGMFKSSPNHPSKRAEERAKEPMFLHEGGKKDTDRWSGGYVEDDHVPFMARGVEILHIITAPFPTVWHTIQDDGEHLDLDTVEDWAMLTLAFVAEWLELEGYFDDVQPAVRRSVGRDEHAGRDEL
ncbi:Glutaminyl-peptide cyclotransferase [Fulvia fulva]|uniref:Peptide hydrolase n=1 Tax=Passalora fulva TaxID=5499 RepID=A0A9Q8L8Z8_PASFU|nr:Glutaminyl-peptide cyclotransferase [Fulvia fulva]KAK4638354.1 Glutaminyl-peptide cyclotransferase [Fulvia fulva]UJO12985.1 Glutaminyl-peptide cyclotransferase [Fulvia fulva]